MNCEKCFYHAKNTHSCDYLLIEKKARGCSVENCDKYITRASARKKVSPVVVCNNYNIPRDLRPRALELYNQGLLDTEIAHALNTNLSSVLAWRRKNSLESNCERLLAGAV